MGVKNRKIIPLSIRRSKRLRMGQEWIKNLPPYIKKCDTKKRDLECLQESIRRKMNKNER